MQVMTRKNLNSSKKWNDSDKWDIRSICDAKISGHIRVTTCNENPVL